MNRDATRDFLCPMYFANLQFAFYFMLEQSKAGERRRAVVDRDDILESEPRQKQKQSFPQNS